MIWFWLGFFALVALLLVLDLGILHRKATEPTLRSAALWTVGWVALGLSFAGVVYLIYEHHWLGAHLPGSQPGHGDGSDAAETYASAYLLEQALSVDNIFVIALVFYKRFKLPVKYQHRVLFWGILGAIVFRVAMLGGGAFLAARFWWIFLVFGAYLALQGIKLLLEGNDEKDDDDDEGGVAESRVLKFLRKYFRIVDGVQHDGKFFVQINGRRVMTTVFVCLIVVELTDIVFAMDSIPAVLSVSQDTFIMVTSNIFAILGLRSLYFVLAKSMEEFRYLKLALGVLLVGIGAKMVAHRWYDAGHLISLLAILGILSVGVIASLVASARERASPSP
jgi:tellurite resistance protein TerC